MLGASSQFERNVIKKFHETLDIDKEIEIQFKYPDLSIKQYLIASHWIKEDISRLPATHLKLIAYHDASYTNLKDGRSQRGYAIVIKDVKETLFSLLVWQSKRIKRVMKSTLAANLCLCS